MACLFWERTRIGWVWEYQITLGKSCEEDLLLWLRMAALDCRRRKNGWKDDEDDNALIAWLMAAYVDGIV